MKSDRFSRIEKSDKNIAGGCINRAPPDGWDQMADLDPEGLNDFGSSPPIEFRFYAVFGPRRRPGGVPEDAPRRAVHFGAKLA